MDNNSVFNYSSKNKDALKFVHQATLEILGWTGDPFSSVKSAMAADAQFGFPYVMLAALEVLSTGVRGDDKQLLEIFHKAENLLQSASAEEKLHYEAIKLCNEGRFERALQIWEKMLDKNPWDALAFKYYGDVTFYSGRIPDLYSLSKQVIPFWNEKKGHPYYGYIMGIASFGYEEVAKYADAEKLATIGLDCNPTDGWSAHMRAHVYEMTDKPDEGIQFMTKFLDNWKHSVYLASHNFWHLALYYIEKGEFESAMKIVDSEVLPRCVGGSSLNLVDASSILLRLEFQGVDVGNRWTKVYPHWEPHLNDHILVFNDAHLLMAMIGSKQPKEKIEGFVKSVEDYANKKQGNEKITNQKMCEIGLPLLRTLVSYSKGQYQDVVDNLVPLLPQMIKIGGSNAQRDIFHQLAICAAIKAQDFASASKLLNESLELKPNGRFNARLKKQIQRMQS